MCRPSPKVGEHSRQIPSTTRAAEPVARGRIVFRYDAENDIVIATPFWKLQTEDDARAWYRQYETYMKRFRRKMDFIVVLDELDVGQAIGPYWGDLRAELLSRYTRLNYRVRGKRTVKLYVNTSDARHNVATQDASSVEEAVAAILRTRAAGNMGLTAPP